MLKADKVFWAVIIGAGIIGACLYFGLKSEKEESPILQTPIKTNGASDVSSIITPKSVAVSDVAINSKCGAGSDTIVTKVIDGDTVVVEGGYHIRLLGIDADEKGYACYDQAKTGLEKLVLGKNVVLEKDITDTDQYGRCLRYVFVGGQNVDVELVKEGLAVARFYNDVKYKPEITSAEKYAQESKIGCKWDK